MSAPNLARAVNGWRRVPEDEERLTKAGRAVGLVVGPELQVYHHGPRRLSVLVGREDLRQAAGVQAGPPEPRWHLSVRHEERVPTWDELVDAAHDLRPGVVFVVGVPPRSWWLNVHEHVLHLWETRDEDLVASWAAERQGHRPTAGVKR